MRKKIFVFALLSMSLCEIARAEIMQTLTINGQKVEKIVSQLTFSGDNVVLHFEGSEESYPLNDVVIDFSSSAGINDLKTFQFGGIIDGQLKVVGLSDGTNVSIFDTLGKKVCTTRANNHETVINVRGLNKGVYILMAGNQIVKFVKR